MRKSNLKTSPLPETVPVFQMTFAEAIPVLLDGKRITRLAWNTPETVIGLENQLLRIRFAGEDKFKDLLLHEGDLAGTDWVIAK